MMRFRFGHRMFPMMGGGWLMMLFWGAIIALVVYLIVNHNNDDGRKQIKSVDSKEEDRAVQIARERYARGEIDRDELEEILRNLR